MGHIYKGENVKARSTVISTYQGVTSSVGRYDKDIWPLGHISPCPLGSEISQDLFIFKGYVSFPGTSVLYGLSMTRGLGQVELVPGTHELEPK